ncbi:MAG: hypothetical protein VB086_04250 [Clostridiaceae bacterium]|nr:hypothetical protein [Clostridiaceae bacterium]
MCGLFGFSNYGKNLSALQINSLTEALATESAVRGTDATGISYNAGDKLKIEKAAKSAYLMDFRLPKDTAALIGHTRHSTQGSCRKWYNNHPFQGSLPGGGAFALAHNGIIGNDKALRESCRLPKTKVETDSYVAVQLLEREKSLSFSSMKAMAEALRGSFTFSLLDDRNNIYWVKGDSPLHILHLKRLKLYVYASTEQILWRALSTSMLSELKSGSFEEIPADEGEILRLSSEGVITRGSFAYLSNYFMSGIYHWWDAGDLCDDTEDYYVAELKSMAGGFGYTSEEIDGMLQSGYSPEEIEDRLYCDSYPLR